jgi:hypothetical protein
MWYFSRRMHNWYLTHYPNWSSFSNCILPRKSKKFIDVQSVQNLSCLNDTRGVSCCLGISCNSCCSLNCSTNLNYVV